VKYDRFKDLTVETCGQLVTRNTEPTSERLYAAIFGINGVARYQGQTRSPPIKVLLTILYVQMQARGGISKPEFTDERTLYLLTDSSRMELPLIKEKPTIETTLTAEIMSVELPKTIVEGFLRAHTVEGRLGTKEFTFDQKEFAIFQDYLRGLLPFLPQTATPSAPRKRG
jgi:hypothetical protein